jgi:hypothetical protein
MSYTLIYTLVYFLLFPLINIIDIFIRFGVK